MARIEEDHPYRPEDPPYESEFVNCRLCGKPRGLHKYPIPHPDKVEPEKVDGERGIYPKYVVFKHPDFKPDKVEGKATLRAETQFGADFIYHLELIGDFIFTLRPSRDYHARVALAAYAESVRHWNPLLADDIDDALDLVQSEPPRMEPT